MNKLKLTMLSMALLFVGVASAQTLDEVTDKYNQAGEFLTNKKYAEAIPLFEEVVVMGTKVGEEADDMVKGSKGYLTVLYLATGNAKASASDYDAALELYNKAYKLSEMSGQAANKLKAADAISKVYLIQGGNAYNSKDYAKAIEVFSKGYAAAPTNTKLALYLADSYDKIDSLDRSVEVYKSIMALTPTRYAEDAATAKSELTKNLLYRASTASASKNLDDVVKLTGMVLEFDPTNATAALMRVQTASNAKKYAAVAQYAPAAIETQTDAAAKADIYFLLGVAYDNLGDKAKAIDSFKKVTSGKNAENAKKQVADLSK